MIDLLSAISLAVLTQAVPPDAQGESSGPVVMKVDPPAWWPGHAINPVRLLVRGSNFRGAPRFFTSA